MRARLTLAFALLAALLVGPSAIASADGRPVSPDAARGVVAPLAYPRLLAGPTYSISGHVLDFGGHPVSGAEVDWGWWTSLTDYSYGGTNLTASPSGTDANGSFALSGVSGGHLVDGMPSDDLDVWYNPSQPGLEEIEAYTLDFAANNDASAPPYSYQLQPALVDVILANAPTTVIETRAGNTHVGYARSDVALTGGAGLASVLPMPSFNDLTAYVYGGSTNHRTCPASVEWLGTPVSVSAGQTAAATISLDWHNAQYAALAGPVCRHSGKPGSMARMTLRGWPTGEKASFVGYYNGPSNSNVYAATVTSAGATVTYSVPLKIYAKAPVGIYQIGVFRTDNLESFTHLWDNFQVCTFKASASAISSGGAIRLSGKVPASGQVILYASQKLSAQPSSLAAKGWTKLGAYPVKSQAFSTGRLHPKHTTYYVARYDGDAFPAFTSVVGVVVH